MWYARAVRWGLTAFLLYGVYEETGPASTIVLTLLVIRCELEDATYNHMTRR